MFKFGRLWTFPHKRCSWKCCQNLPVGKNYHPPTVALPPGDNPLDTRQFFFVSLNPMQNFTILGQPLLGERFVWVGGFVLVEVVISVKIWSKPLI